MPEHLEQPLKILIADDSNSDRLLLKAIVLKQGHIPLLAADGIEAIEVFKQEKPDIILLDALMPRLDGFETAKYIKAHSGDYFIPIIFLTSLSEADSLARCLEVGGDDFLTKPYNNIILKAKIHAFKRMLKMHVTLQQQRDQIALHNERLVREQEVAKLTFDKIAHEGSLNAPNIRYRLSPMAIFNGDVLLAAMRPNGNLCVLLGDFTGHGLAAAIGAMPLSQTFYSMVAKGFSISDMLVEMNHKLKEILPVGVFCCAVMIDMDFRNKQVEVWNGGMPDSYLFHPKRGSITAIASSHVALGIFPANQFVAKTSMHRMDDGDSLYLWSDGIIEAENPQSEMFGEQRLKDIFFKNQQPDSLYDEINATVDRFIANSNSSDDLSIAEVTMVDGALLQKNSLPAARVFYPAKPADFVFSFEFGADSLRHSEPLHLLYKVLSGLPGLQAYSKDLFTVLSELYSNALEHGVLRLASSLKSSHQGFSDYYVQRGERLQDLEQGFVRFEISYRYANNDSHLTVIVSDSGEGFDVSALQSEPTDLARYSGRGLPLVRAFCQSVEYLGKGNQVKIIFEW